MSGSYHNWCKAWNYSSNKDKPSTAWVSENFLGYAICSKGLIPLINALPSISTGVKNMIIETISTYNTLIAMIMSPAYQTDVECDHLLAVIKIFLSRFNDLDGLIITRTTPKVETASCLVNLLDIPLQIKRKGVLRNFWEGDMKGKGIVRVLKPLIRRGIQLPGTLKNVMKRMYNIQAITELIEMYSASINDLFAENGDDNHDNNEQQGYDKNRFQKFKSFKDQEDISSRMRSGTPLAGVYLNESSTFYFIIGRGLKKELLQYYFHAGHVLFNTVCFRVEIVNSRIPCPQSYDSLRDMTSLVMIPMTYSHFDDTDCRTTFYYVRSEFHMELLSINPIEFITPKIHLYDERHPTGNRTNNLGERHQQQIIGPDGVSTVELSAFRDREFCRQWLNRKCKPIQGCDYAVVTGFSFTRGLADFNNCKWTIKYYRDETNTRTAQQVKIVSYHELIQCLDN